jgi:hypothetical protein
MLAKCFDAVFFNADSIGDEYLPVFHVQTGCSLVGAKYEHIIYGCIQAVSKGKVNETAESHKHTEEQNGCP